MQTQIALNADYTAIVETSRYGDDKPVIVLLQNGRRTPGQWFASTLCEHEANGPLYIDYGANWKIDADANRTLRAFAAQVLKAVEASKVVLAEDATVVETSVIFRFADGRKALRGLPGEATDTDLVNKAVELGAVSWMVLGTVEGRPDTIVCEVDYDPSGARTATVKRTMAR